MDSFSLILIVIILQSVLTINEAQRPTKNNILLDKLLPELVGGSLDEIISAISRPPSDSNTDGGGRGDKKTLSSRLESLLPSGQRLSSLSGSNPLAALASLASLTSSMASFTSNPFSSISSFANLFRSKVSSQLQNSLSTDPDSYRSTEELIISRGFSYDDHYVTTKDGAILHLFRINNPHAQAVLGYENLHPVLLQHGGFSSSAVWLINSPGETVAPWVNRHKPLVTGNNLATFLANQGFDVWLGNSRGNRYSTNHTSLDAENDPAFWEFSFDEIVKEDAPAMIDHVLKVTRKDKLTLVGYSLGTTQFLGLLSFLPQYADHIDLFFALAPIGYAGNVKGPIGTFSDSRVASEIIQQFDGKFPPIGDLPIDKAILLLCNNQITKVLCATAVDYVGGLNAKQLNQSRLFVYLNHLDYVSAKLVNHLFQVRQSKIFHLYDYGESENQIKYGYKDSPKYPFSNINLDKIVLISGLNDLIASPEDVHQLRKKLSGKILIDHVVKNPKWNHWDFVLGKNAYENINKFIAETIEKYSGKQLVNPQINQI